MVLRDNIMQGKRRDSFFNGLGITEDIFNSKNKPLPKIIEEAKETLEKATKFINKIDSERQTSINNAKDVPENATIKEEYVNL